MTSRQRRLRAGRVPELPPNPLAVAAIDGALDAITNRINLPEKQKLSLRAVFGMMLGVAIEKDAELKLDGCDPITIRKQDTQAVAMRSLGELTRLEVEHATDHLAEVARKRQK